MGSFFFAIKSEIMVRRRWKGMIIMSMLIMQLNRYGKTIDKYWDGEQDPFTYWSNKRSEGSGEEVSIRQSRVKDILDSIEEYKSNLEY